MTDRYAAFEALKFERPAPGVLRLVLDAPNLNAVDATDAPGAGRHLAGRSTATRRRARVVVQGAGKAFSAGGSFDLIEDLTKDHDVRARVMREARDMVYNVINCSKPIISAIHGPAVGAGLVVGAAGRHLDRRPHRARSSTGTPAWAWPPATTRPSAGRCCAAWPRPSTTC